MTSIKKDDTVVVLSGKDRGKKGRVLRSFPKKQSLIVQGVNVYKKHEKPSQKNEKGGIVDKEMPIHISNVALDKQALDKQAKVEKKDKKDK